MDTTRRNFVHNTAGITCAALAAPTVFGATQKTILRAGAAETIVTPGKGVLLIGPMKAAEGVHDDLFARILVLDDGDIRLVIATLDYLGFDFAYTNMLLKAIAEGADVPVTNVMLNCSHTHSAPLSAPWGPWLKEKNLPFHHFLPERLVKITRRAVSTLRPAIARHHREPVQIGFNRRLLHNGRITMEPNPHGAVLPWVDVLVLEESGGEEIAMLFSHAAHPVIVHDTSTLVSADYPGFAVEQVRRKSSGKAICLFAQGCGGNINAFPWRGGIDAAKAAGRDLGRAALRASGFKDAQKAGGALKTESLHLDLPLQAPPPVKELRAMIAKEKHPGSRTRREELLAIAESGEKPTASFPIRAFAMGQDLCMLGMPNEPFAEYHLFANKASAFRHTFAFGYTNGMEYYVGTKKDYELGKNGGYETSPFGAALMFKNRLPLALEAESMIQQGIKTVLRKLAV